MRVEGLSKSPHFNGLFAHIERRLEGGRYGVTLEHDGKVFSLKSVNLIIADKLGVTPETAAPGSGSDAAAICGNDDGAPLPPWW